MNEKPVHFHRIEDAAPWLIAQLGRKMKVATPLGLGKPNLLINALVGQVEKDAALSLKIYTALSLDPPHPTGDLESRFFAPFAERHWGKAYPRLAYLKPHPSIEVHEFYFQAGVALSSPSLQQNYQSINYTHVARRVFESEVQAVVQLIAKRETSDGVRYSLSCNPDLTLDLKDLYLEAKKPFHMVGVVHPDLPFLGGEAEVDESFFTAIVEDETNTHTLFALPRVPVDETDHAIGFYASQLIADEGTLQVGIGSLNDAIVHSLLIRHQKNADYQALLTAAYSDRPLPEKLVVESKPFQHGLYGLSEMITDGFMHLRNAGILKRHVRDELSGRSTYLHGAFFLGTKVFYEWLRKLSKEDYDGLRMSRISKINDLYDPNEILLRKQRKNARFMNTCMEVTLLGGAASETLENGKVVSGVGGQYNFVSMSHELVDARSILMLRSTRTKHGKRTSNLVWAHGQLTIPRHLRDIVITEYGIADVRNTTDAETIAALLNITDSEFQEELLATAKQNLKIAADYEIPAWAKHNTPEKVKAWIQMGQASRHFGAFPFGSDFTPEEEKLALALGKLAPLSTSGIAKELFHAGNSDSHEAELKRMGLDRAGSIKGSVYRRLLQSALSRVDSEMALPTKKP
jgi:acyl-CoA hydrolase